MNIPKALREELLEHIIETITDQDLESFEELHFHAFNEDYYMIGYYQATQWLKKHDIDAFAAIARVIEWESEVIGEVTLKAADINSESIVNKLVYALGEELLSEFDLEQSREALINDLRESI